MGVRFQCPHGHKLHVKAELAGKRAICPECGAKFIVPAFSGGRVEWDTGGGPTGNGDAPASGAASEGPPPSKGGARGGIESAPPSPAATPPQAASSEPVESVLIQTQPPPIAAASEPPAAQAPTSEPIAWYVRPAAGGQFGPATTEVFQQWIEDGRVAVDSWVWRTGWADWKAGGEALAQIADRPSLEPGASIATASAPRAASPAPVVTTEALAGAAAHIEPASADVRRAEIKRRKDRVRRLSTILALVALAMLMGLVFVLAQ